MKVMIERTESLRRHGNMNIEFDERMYIPKDSFFMKDWENSILDFKNKALNEKLIINMEHKLTGLLHAYRNEGTLLFNDDLEIQMMDCKDIIEKYYVFAEKGNETVIKSMLSNKTIKEFIPISIKEKFLVRTVIKNIIEEEGKNNGKN